MEQCGQGHRLPQPGQLTIGDELLGYHIINNNYDDDDDDDNDDDDNEQWYLVRAAGLHLWMQVVSSLFQPLQQVQ